MVIKLIASKKASYALITATDVGVGSTDFESEVKFYLLGERAATELV